ncbi:hypothetical protein F5883DRAFT_669392 [Diaporthe sp. PMI_573]|nr:hypothetical protein F5883DRAFT_669392 [Diaporthaceae sp. PMI_573]
MSEGSVALGRRRNATHSVAEGVSKKSFLDAIRKFASRKKEDHVFSGEHYEFLKDFLDQPPSRVRDGASFITTSVSARASRKSIDQAAEVNRIAILAYFFVPMSFVTSIFGMNVVEFGDLGWGIGAIFIVLAFVMIPSLLLGFWKTMPWVASRVTPYNGFSSNA